MVELCVVCLNLRMGLFIYKEKNWNLLSHLAYFFNVVLLFSALEKLVCNKPHAFHES